MFDREWAAREALCSSPIEVKMLRALFAEAFTRSCTFIVRQMPGARDFGVLLGQAQSVIGGVMIRRLLLAAILLSGCASVGQLGEECEASITMLNETLYTAPGTMHGNLGVMVDVAGHSDAWVEVDGQYVGTFAHGAQGWRVLMDATWLPDGGVVDAVAEGEDTGCLVMDHWLIVVE